MLANLIAIDGKRGTGKSLLASGLRQVFDCDVLELGPVFRLFSWVHQLNPDLNISEILALIIGWLNSGQLEVDMTRSGSIAATRMLLNSKDLTDDLWSPTLNEAVRTLASSTEGVDCVAKLARRLLKDRRTIIVGRESGTRIFPDAAAKILLYADQAVSEQRKVRQLGLHPENSSDVQASEPSLEPSLTVYDLSLDTSNTSPQIILEKTMNFVSDRLGWSNR